jgi:parallel beta-helix repeat protein
MIDALPMKYRAPVKANYLAFVLAVSLCGILKGRSAVFIVSNVNDGTSPVPAGSLRAALNNANANPGLDTIVFQVPGTGVHTINLAVTLPAIQDPVIIDGTSQPGYAGRPLIELNGAGAGANNAGLRLLAGNSVVRGLVLNRFAGDAIDINPGTLELGPGTNVIQGNFIGTDPSGTARLGNGAEGILISGSTGNVVGGTDPANRNVICGSGDAGVYILSGGTNVVQGNFIGVNAPGISRLSNLSIGIIIYNSTGNVIGGTTPGARNLISGNASSGVYLSAGSSGNMVQGNYIGTDLTGGVAIGNGVDGITIQGAVSNVVGGTDAVAGNVVSGNGGSGIQMVGTGTTDNLVQGNLIGTDASGRSALGNALWGITIWGAANNVVGGTVAGALNVISGNKQDGIYILTNSTGNRVQGNYVGVDVTGRTAVGNTHDGILINSASGNIIGGTMPGAGNLLSGNGFFGAQFVGGATANSLQGNYVGTDALGRTSIANLLSGVRVDSGGNIIGGISTGAGNLISGNTQDGIFIVGAAATSNLVQGNLIGTQAGGTNRLGNGWAGIAVSGAPANTIGGIASGAGNVISANALEGIYLINSGAAGNQIQGNTIGADVNGTLALGNGSDGIRVEGAPTNTIGGAVPGAGNLISANGDGIYVLNSSWCVIQGNLIGTQRDGLSGMGNSYHGVELDSGSNSNLIGGATAQAGNRIAFSPHLYSGVRLRAGATNDTILSNAIFSNGGFGIDLEPYGPNSNTPCGAGTGPNGNENYPQLTQAVAGANTVVHGTLNSRANGSYLLQFFANSVCASLVSGYGQGEIFLGQTTVPTGPDCNASFVVRLDAGVSAGYFITATSTDSAGNTSEFSPCVPVVALPLLTVTRGGDSGTATNQVILTWNNTAGLVLKQSSSLAPPIQWTPVSETPVLIGDQLVLRLPAGSGNRFYQLSYQ